MIGGHADVSLYDWSRGGRLANWLLCEIVVHLANLGHERSCSHERRILGSKEARDSNHAHRANRLASVIRSAVMYHPCRGPDLARQPSSPWYCR